jgi:monoterpene epsilon-lactone hydrolase
LDRSCWRDADTSIDPLSSPAGLDEISDYLAGADPHQGLASPLFADLSDLPPLLIQVAPQDILMSDGTRLADKAREAGIDLTLAIEQGAFHVWHHAAPEAPESTAAIERVGAFVSEHMR